MKSIFFSVLRCTRTSRRIGPLDWIGSTDSAILQSAINLQTTDIELGQFLRQFQQTKELPKKELLTEEEKRCERLYTATVRRQKSARYTVKLPVKDTFPVSGNLGDSYSMRFEYSITQRDDQEKILNGMYEDYLNEYIALDQMVKVEASSLDLGKCYFLSYHTVLKESSSAIKLP